MRDIKDLCARRFTPAHAGNTMLKSGEVTPLYFDGQPVDQESINLLLDQIKISVAFIAKQRKK